jgi:hypothetical protein
MSLRNLPNKKPATKAGRLFGTPRGIRTPGLLIRSQALYPAELSVRAKVL